MTPPDPKSAEPSTAEEWLVKIAQRITLIHEVCKDCRIQASDTELVAIISRIIAQARREALEDVDAQLTTYKKIAQGLYDGENNAEVKAAALERIGAYDNFISRVRELSAKRSA